MISNRPALLCFAAIFLLQSACTFRGVYKQELMTAPTVYAEGIVDPFEGVEGGKKTNGVFYATDRAPAVEGDGFRFYTYDRGRMLRFGRAHIRLDIEENLTWEEARKVSLSTDRGGRFPLLVDEIEEFGIHSKSVPDVLASHDRTDEPSARYAAAIDARLEASGYKDVCIYVHGYKAEFTYPLLIAGELWHFLGYEGVFIGYSWTATPNPLAYFKDIESAGQTARNLRLLLEFLGERTKARRIHILGYSAGTRVVAGAISQLALKHFGKSKEELAETLRIGRVVLVGSDVDRDLMLGYVDDGFLNVTETFTLYQSDKDGPLDLAQRVFGRKRTGQLLQETPTPDALTFSRQRPDLVIVDVTKAEGAYSGNGHGYFLKSPWASSDILLNFRYGLPPEKRGLVREEGEIHWSFPDDYVERLRKAIE